MKSLHERRAERERDDRRQVRELLAAAELALERGDLEEALRLHEEAKRLDPDASEKAPREV
jgi:hypothetical protein